MKSATHYGHCQICGSQQKAPEGLIAKHGYTVEFNFFNGICSGSDRKPFEVEKLWAERHIDQVYGDIARLHKMISGLLSEGHADGRVWRNIYIPAHFSYGNNVSSRYEWQHVGVVVERHDYEGGFYFSASVEGERNSHHTSSGVETVAEYLDELERPYRQMLARQIGKLISYISWQEDRCRDWVPTAQKPVIENEGKDCIVSVAGKGFIRGTAGRGGWHGAVQAWYTESRAEAQLYSHKGATMAISKLRGYKTMKVERAS